MNNTERWMVKCQDTKDGSGDVIVGLPPALLEQAGLGVGDVLTINVVDGAIVLHPMHAPMRGVFLGAVLQTDVYREYRIRLENLLGIPVEMPDQAIHERIETGFPASLLQALFDKGIISAAQRDMIVPYRALKRRLAGDQLLRVNESDRMFRATHIFAMAEAIFGDTTKAKHWLSKPKSRFTGKSPYEMLSTASGLHRVEEMIVQISEVLSFSMFQD